MNTTNVSQIFSTTSNSTYISGGITNRDNYFIKPTEEEWLVDKTVAGFRVWQLAGIIISIVITITVGLCCCIKFRIPRTNQEIEADWIRKQITRSFRQELNKIPDKEMDEIDLKEAMEKVRAGFDAEREQVQQEEKQKFEKPQGELRVRFNKMFRSIHARFNPAPPEIDTMI